ncbi:adenylosuccinate synthase [Candidatus Peregrinibacteria bacterium CG10_big_fil_rev_8_21_14_0_10_36_19]|nr:MAG: adenylosuccinate synthase [Candidatus Peregrinibacteria bacterium CG10_big_fil_rev_8_21_14_0_10_36_19]
MSNSKVAVILGAQWGDEGKGKLIDILSEKYKIVARATGGANAGHTIYLKDQNGERKKYVFHLVPSGMLNENCVCLLGNGVALHIPTFFQELKLLRENGIKTEGRVLISDRIHLLFEYHKIVDGIQEDMKGDKKVGTTKRGIGPCYTDKVRRNGIRMCDLLEFETFKDTYHENLKMLKSLYGDFEYDTEKELAELESLLPEIKKMVVDGAYYLNDALENGDNILVEGANGALLDIDHGTYPYVTSSSPTIGGICTGIGLGANKLTQVIGIMKAYCTRVGSGPFPTELTNELGDQIREQGGEYGSTTGRPRRCGWYDAVAGAYSVMINGLTELNLTKLDVLTGVENLKIATAYKLNGEKLRGFPANTKLLDKIEVEYIELPGWTEDISKAKTFEDLPENAKKYIETIEKLSNCKVTSIGIGPARDEMIFR